MQGAGFEPLHLSIIHSGGLGAEPDSFPPPISVDLFSCRERTLMEDSGFQNHRDLKRSPRVPVVTKNPLSAIAGMTIGERDKCRSGISSS